MWKVLKAYNWKLQVVRFEFGPERNLGSGQGPDATSQGSGS